MSPVMNSLCVIRVHRVCRVVVEQIKKSVKCLLLIVLSLYIRVTVCLSVCLSVCVCRAMW
jgi:hypothetical protein